MLRAPSNALRRAAMHPMSSDVSSWRSRWQAWAPRPAVALGLLALWLLLSLGWRPLLLPDEGRYAGVALEMLHRDVLVPTLLGLPYFHKPPLMYWIDVAAMSLLGVNALAARMAPALGGWLMAAALYLTLRQRPGGARQAGLALVVLATTPFYFVGAQYANHDMLVAGLISVAILAARHAVQVASPLRWVVLAWAAAALALLSKGLIGIVLPVAVLLPWLLATRRWQALRSLLHPLGVASFVLIAAPWFVAMQLRFPAFFDYFFIEQHFRRFTGSDFNNAQPWWFFAPVLLLLTLPWSAALWATWRGRSEANADDERGFWLWWLLVVVVFFSLPTSKLVGYVLPALPPLVALLVPALGRGRAWRWLLPLAAALCLAIVAVLAWQAPKSNADIGLALRDAALRGERVVFVDDAYFDLPFYARMRRAPLVLGDWDSPAIDPRDDWRKELRDAARFAGPGAASPLWPLSRGAELWCHNEPTWFVAAPGWRPPPAWGQASLVLKGRQAELLRALPGASQACP